jgi:hypothetical protein
MLSWNVSNSPGSMRPVHVTAETRSVTLSSPTVEA